MNLSFLSLSPSLTLNILQYQFILGIIKANGSITLSKYPIKFLELVFVSINFGITILSTLTLQHETFLLLLLSLLISTLL